VFLKRFFERKQISVPFAGQPIFRWVLLTHAHSDHGLGLLRVLRTFGASEFWRPSTSRTPRFLVNVVRFVANSPNLTQPRIVDSSRRLPNFGDVTLQILWPPVTKTEKLFDNENNNSVVLALTLGRVTFVLTGDAEAEGVWSQIARHLPKNTRFFKVPHHGAINSTFDANWKTPWLDSLPGGAKVAISSHVLPHKHPDPKVTATLDNRRVDTYRTDRHSHVTFETDGVDMSVQYSHT
jgi:competence protein ComEC